MNSPTTKEEALDQCEALWKNLAETGSGLKNPAPVLGYIPRNACPACEWAYSQALNAHPDSMCDHCPITAWNAVNRDVYLCETDFHSPFYKWLIAESHEERSVAAIKLLQLIAESR
jgi:rubredoxin